jgi:signal transduction histidine kinase
LKPRTTDLPAWGASLATKIKALSPREWSVLISLHGAHLLDPERVTQAVVQLAANAIAYTPPTAALELRLTSRAETLCADVIDHGSGIPPDVRERIFDRFARATPFGRGAGSGLGLSIVAAVAAAHGGTVKLTDTAGGGATFTLSVPYLDADAAV